VRGVRRRLLRRRARRGPRRAAAVHRRAARRRRHRERAARGGHRWLGGRTRLAVVPPTQHGFNPLLPPPGVSPRFRPLEGEHMTESRLPVTLFTGQWADMPFEELAEKAAAWGYDGLEIAASGDHLDLKRADEDDAYVRERLEILDRHGLKCWAISNHLAGQAVCDAPIDFRHQAILREYVWGDGEPEGVRQRAAEDMKRAARVARKLGVDTVVGFTGSSIWPYLAMFPPVPPEVIDRGYEDFAERWNPILDVFDAEGVRFAHEVHPGEIAYDYWTSQRTLEAIGHREAFGFNWDPSHMMW